MLEYHLHPAATRWDTQPVDGLAGVSNHQAVDHPWGHDEVRIPGVDFWDQSGIKSVLPVLPCGGDAHARHWLAVRVNHLDLQQSRFRAAFAEFLIAFEGKR